ncbi:arginine--tRNA ligase [Patescibacteria group bacterium]|nr:arginine--tRNA ligase [Patescibacteria group bacterium]MBU1500657.1 arginine--tRNA ligase [Patescibacteria group bacterium]MBU2080390.1 arginine--tRNA ligase [Patescibacteria group bacterium]MBU2124198.1 arginine--tRNA ligase [Patescibacteria group bacterium]MBU2194351.1 arginine--tRNA ligase [Patescibacteria group bacterium]
MEQTLRDAVQNALNELGVPETEFVIEWPADLAHGDFATNAALACAKVLGRSPREIAEELVEKLQTTLGDSVKHIEAAGPGFVNITLAHRTITKQVEGATVKDWGTHTYNTGKSVMIEYSNPNPFKEIHIGHLMSNVVGEALSRVLEASGARVVRDTFGGDVGPHVAKALWALKKNNVTDIGNAGEIGKAYIQGSNAYEASKEAKEEIDALNTRIYDIVATQLAPETLSEEDREILNLWRKGREVSMEEFARIFSILGTRFDYIFYDSDTTEGGISVVRDGVTSGVFEQSEGAIIYRGEKKGLHTLVFITSRGTPTYETKDIGLAFLKEERCSTDEVIIITAIEQVGHFEVVLAALEEIAPQLAKKMTHVPHGLLRLTTGKMSSRKGNIITASELLADMVRSATEKNADPLVAEQVAVAAVKYMILRQAPGGDIVFDPEKSLSLEGDSGPYLQYALVRAKSVIAQSSVSADTSDAPEEPYTLERLIIRFPEIIRKAERLRAPHLITQYVTQLAGEWNSFYAKERIRDGAHEAYKIAVATAFVRTMEQGLHFLGIPVPEKM